MRRKIKILTGVLLLCITAAAVLYPLSYAAAESASAADFQMKGDTLVKYTGTASAVSLPTSVKEIGREAFAGHSELVKVQIPGYVERIDSNAFNGCSSLETIAIPDTVTAIGNGAFAGCSSLKSISLGKKFKTLGNGVFADCVSLTSASVSRDNTEYSYEDGVIYSKDKKIAYAMLPGYESDTYRMPSSVEEIKSNAFWGCQKLKKVEVGSRVTEIPDYAFSNCTNLEKVMLPYSLHSIGIKAFSDCINLGETEIPVSVADIHATAFDGCPKLTITAEAGSKAAEFEANRDKSNVAQTEYQDIAAENTGGDGSSADGTGSSAGESSADGTGSAADTNLLGQSSIVAGNAVVFIDNSQSKVLSGNDRPDTGDGAAKAEVIGTQAAGAFPKYTIVDNEKIASQAFYNKQELSAYRMPDSIKEIGDFAFARSGLTSVTIPEGVTKIGYGAFYHCSALADITVPSTVTEIEPSAFAETKWMEEREADRLNPFTIVGDGILIAYSGMGSRIEIPDGVKQIGAEVFKDNDRITSVTLPAGLTIIGEDAFAGCSSLSGISGGGSLEEIRDRAFEGCPISTIKIPASVKTIGLKAYDLTGTDKADGTKNAVFLGKTLPKISYEKTATRLMNETYRDGILKSVEIAVVDDSIGASDIEGSVLDYDMGGFRGLICSVKQAASGENPGILKVKFCVMPPEKMTAELLPEQAVVYGKTYQIEAPEGDLTYLSGTAQEQTTEGTVRVENRCTTLPAAPAATAEIAGSKENYILRIEDNTTDGSAMALSYKKAVPGGRITSLQVYDLMLYDAKRMIPITRLGRQRMTVTIPKPKGILAENLKVACLDEDGQIEHVESRLVTVNGETCVQFTASHFSVYGVYN